MPFRKGQGGRRKGARNRIPKTFKATIESIYADIHSEHPDIIKNAVLAGLTAESPMVRFPYVKLWAEYNQGKPIERHEHSGEVRLPTKVIFELHD